MVCLSRASIAATLHYCQDHRRTLGYAGLYRHLADRLGEYTERFPMYLMVLLTTRMARSAPHPPLRCRRLSASLYQLDDGVLGRYLCLISLALLHLALLTSSIRISPAWCVAFIDVMAFSNVACSSSLSEGRRRAIPRSKGSVMPQETGYHGLAWLANECPWKTIQMAKSLLTNTS